MKRPIRFNIVKACHTYTQTRLLCYIYNIHCVHKFMLLYIMPWVKYLNKPRISWNKKRKVPFLQIVHIFYFHLNYILRSLIFSFTVLFSNCSDGISISTYFFFVTLSLILALQNIKRIIFFFPEQSSKMISWWSKQKNTNKTRMSFVKYLILLMMNDKFITKNSLQQNSA